MYVLSAAALFGHKMGSNVNVWEEGGSILCTLPVHFCRTAKRKQPELHVALWARLKKNVQKHKLLILYSVKSLAKMKIIHKCLKTSGPTKSLSNIH